MEKLLASSIHVLVGGVCFDLHCDELPILHEVHEAYRQFTGTGECPRAGSERVDVEVTVAPLSEPDGEVLLDCGSWRVVARGGERSLVFWPRSHPEPMYEARFRPGSRHVSLVCAPRLVESEDGVPCVRSHFRYPLDQVLMMYQLGQEGLILHAAGLVCGESGLACAGVSGAGKSTLVRLAAGRRDLLAVSDDRVILRVRGTGVELHGTPWPGEAGVAEARCVQARAVLFLEQGERNEVRPSGARETLARLLPAVSLPCFDALPAELALRACDAVVGTLRAGVLTFRPEPGALAALEPWLDRARESVDGLRPL